MLYTNTIIAGNKSLLPLADHKSRILILDNLPIGKSKILHQYYANKSNYFWRIVFKVFHEPDHTNYKMKKEMLLRNGISLWNVLETTDSGYEQPNDFRSFLQMHRTINRIIFNGNNAAECFIRHFGYLPGLTYKTLPSTSSLNTWKSFDERTVIWSQELRKA